MVLPSPPSLEELQDRLAQLEVENFDLRSKNVSLVADRKGLLSIASRAVQTLKHQQERLQPEGFWFLDGDDPLLEEVMSEARMEVKYEPGSSWTWSKKIPTDARPGSKLPNFSSNSQVKRYSGFKPFASPFPLELFIWIISLGTTEVIAQTCAASFACLELFCSMLYHSIDVVDEDAVNELFCSRLPNQRSLRLTPSLSLNQIQVLELAASSFPPSHEHPPFDRLDGLLNLERLTIIMDAEPYRMEEDDEDEMVPRFISVEFNTHLLTRLNPKELVVQVDFDAVEEGVPAYELSFDTSRIISGWSRLQRVRLEGVDLLSAPEEDLQDEMEDEMDGVCFLGIGGIVEVASKDVALVWDISRFRAGLPSFGWGNIVDLLVKRDRTLFHPSITSATILVSSERQARLIRTTMDGHGQELPSCLTVAVKEGAQSDSEDEDEDDDDEVK